jgi:hypothetical protein
MIGMLERKISVAPMMDWIDDLQIGFSIKYLAVAERPCLLYVSSGL